MLKNKNRLGFLRQLISSAAIIVALFTVGCAEVQIKRNESVPQPVENKNSKDSEQQPFNETQSQTPVPQVEEAPPKIALILGPGGFKSFAHVGVLKELKKANIPIQKIVGFEWGALAAGLFAQRGQVHEVEWKYYKMEKIDWGNNGFFASKSIGYDPKGITGYIRENVDNKEIGQLPVPFATAVLNTKSGGIQWIDSGSLQRAVEAALISPPLFRPAAERSAALFSIKEAAQNLKREGYNVIVLVNILGDGPLFDKGPTKDDYASQVLWSEARRDLWQAKSFVTDVIDVPTRGIPMTDFASRKVLMTAGEAAAERASKSIVEKYGL